MIRLFTGCAVLILFNVSLADDQEQLPRGLVRNMTVRTWPSSEPVVIDHEPQLFIDNYLIAEHTGLTRTTHSPQRIQENPILGWEQGTSQPYLTVLRDPETRKYRMWYNKTDTTIAYAESEDGVHWNTPSLGILGNDNRVLNISVPDQGGYGVSLIDEGPGFSDKARRFKIAWWGTALAPDGQLGDNPGRSLCVAFSPDGLHWTPWKNNPVLGGVDDIVDVYWDPIHRRYGLFFKSYASEEDGYTQGLRAGGNFRRVVGASISEDLVTWSRPWRVLMPEPRDEGQLEFYSVGGTIARGGLLIGFARMLHDDYPANEGGPPDGIGYSTLVTSRDGLHWERHDDIFFDRNPDPNAWDRAMTWIGSAVPMGDELYLYYGGYKRGHKIERNRERQLGLAKMPMDRFVSRDATGDKPGRLLTVPLYRLDKHPHQLLLNADALGGRIRVQVRDAKSNEILPGYTFDDCNPVTKDALALPVTWKKNNTLPGKTIRLEFELTRAGLYGFRLSCEPGEAGAPKRISEAKPAHKVIRVGNRKQLFIDRKFIDRSYNVRIVMNSPTKADIAIECDRPWEDFRITSYFNVLQDGDICRMYYSCFSVDQWHVADAWQNHCYFCYAESTDGIHWKKPNLGLVEFEGSKNNNILMKAVVDATVFVDPMASPERRYKMLSLLALHNIESGLRVSYSADGIHFTMPDKPVAHWIPDSQQNAFWDARIGKYVAYLRGKEEMGIECKSRVVVRAAMDDISKPWTIKPDIVFSSDDNDPPNMDFYTNACVPYPWADDAYFMFPTAYHHYPSDINKGNDGILDSSMAVSREGIKWQRPDRGPYVPLGMNGQWDSKFLMIGVGLVRQDNFLYQYYCGVDLSHGGTRHMKDEKERAKWRRWGKIGRVVQRLDGFCSADAAYEGGWLETPPIVFTGNQLELNINTSAAGLARVAILDADRKPIPGYTLEDCPEIMDNDVAHVVSWKGNSSISALAEKPVRLRFEMRSAKLYAFQFTGDH